MLNGHYAQLTGIIPTTLPKGQTFQVPIEAKNTGTTTWKGSEGFSLGIVGSTGGNDDPVWGVKRWPVPGTVLPGQSCQIVATGITAPSDSGIYVIRFKMLKELEGWIDDALIGTLTAVDVPPPPVGLSALIPGFPSWQRLKGDAVGVRLFNTGAFLASSSGELSATLLNDTGRHISFLMLSVWFGVDKGSVGDVAGLIDRISPDGSVVDTFYNRGVDHYTDGDVSDTLHFNKGNLVLYPNEKLKLRYWYRGTPNTHAHIGVHCLLVDNES